MNVCLKKTNLLANFEKISLIGKGACGSVCLVKDKTTHCAYAIKILNKDDTRKVAKALNEQYVLSHIDHPFVAKSQFCFQTQQNIYIGMEYYAGGDFYSVIKRQPNKCLTETQTQFYASCVLLALEYLHAQGIIYRDLKPENILMQHSGHIVLADFDLSVCSHDPVTPKLFMKPYSHCRGVCSEPNIKCCDFVGTAEYMAPEIIEDKTYNAIVDWWSFGILIFEMLYGQTPFRGVTTNETFKVIHKCHLKFPKHTPNNTKINHKTKNLIKQLLTHNPESRLGFQGGATEIKDYPYFGAVKFPLLKSQTPPIVPKLSGKFDYHYFSSKSHNYTIGDTSNIMDIPLVQQENIWKTVVCN